jgi:aerobic C4-dicarboxylate transport protein
VQPGDSYTRPHHRIPLTRVTAPIMPWRHLWKSLYLQVLFGICAGVVLGYFWPETGAAMRPLGDGFIKLIRMMIAPIVFCTVVVGIAQMSALKELGRIGLRAIIYFEVASSLALVIGLIVVTLVEPGVGVNVDQSALDATAVSAYANAAKSLSATDFALNIIPNTFVDAFTKGDILPVLLLSVLSGLALLHLGGHARPLVLLIDQASRMLFQIVGMIMRLAPVGAFGATAFTIGRYGVGTLLALGKLMFSVYVTCALFVFLVLGLVARVSGYKLWKLLKYIKEEILIVLGTSSSESVLPRVMAKLEHLGCAKSIVGLVVPTGYSFNLDGTSIYMTMGAIFVAQATNAHLTFGEELGILAILLLTSKGAAAVTGSGFITLAATLAAFPRIPVAGLALLVGVDRFMSEARAITNLIGNTVATIAIARWDGALDLERATRVLDGKAVDDDRDALLSQQRPASEDIAVSDEPWSPARTHTPA